MSNDPAKLNCAEFQAQMAELIGSGEDLSAHPHLKNCADCRALLADLQTIAATARQLLLPEAEPSDEVWKHIESVIQQEDKPPSSVR